MKHRKLAAVALVAFLSAQPVPSLACSAQLGTAVDWVRHADVILRVRAMQLLDGTRPALQWERAETQIRFEVLEVLKGSHSDPAVVFEGRVADSDDRNPLRVPYEMVRPGGRTGNCHALNYRIGGEYLLLLGRVDGRLTPYWASLGATNEQVFGADDPWLEWVRQQLKSTSGPPAR